MKSLDGDQDSSLSKECEHCARYAFGIDYWSESPDSYKYRDM